MIFKRSKNNPFRKTEFRSAHIILCQDGYYFNPQYITKYRDIEPNQLSMYSDLGTTRFEDKWNMLKNLPFYCAKKNKFCEFSYIKKQFVGIHYTYHLYFNDVRIMYKTYDNLITFDDDFLFLVPYIESLSVFLNELYDYYHNIEKQQDRNEKERQQDKLREIAERLLA